jgi:hypothetical protein
MRTILGTRWPWSSNAAFLWSFLTLRKQSVKQGGLCISWKLTQQRPLSRSLRCSTRYLDYIIYIALEPAKAFMILYCPCAPCVYLLLEPPLRFSHRLNPTAACANGRTNISTGDSVFCFINNRSMPCLTATETGGGTCCALSLCPILVQLESCNSTMCSE